MFKIKQPNNVFKKYVFIFLIKNNYLQTRERGPSGPPSGLVLHEEDASSVSFVLRSKEQPQ